MQFQSYGLKNIKRIRRRLIYKKILLGKNKRKKIGKIVLLKKVPSLSSLWIGRKSNFNLWKKGKNYFSSSNHSNFDFLRFKIKNKGIGRIKIKEKKNFIHVVPMATVKKLQNSSLNSVNKGLNYRKKKSINNLL